MSFSLRRLLVLASVLASASCGSLNPFSSKGSIPPAPKFDSTSELTSVWSASAGSSENYVLTPASVDGAVFVAAANGRIARLEQGREIWQSNANARISAGVGVGAGRLAVGTDKGEVLAYSLDGKLLWRARVSSEVLASPVLNDTLVLVRTTDNRVHALNAEDGKRRWVYQRSAPALVLRNAGTLLLDDGLAYAGFPGGKLVALSLNNGAAVWESTIALPRGATELERVADVAGEPVLAQRSVCAVAYQGRLGCVDRQTGTVLWSRDISSSSGVAVATRAIYISDERGNVFALDTATGATLWKQDQLAGRSPGRPVAVQGGVAVVDAEGLLFLMRNSDGSFVARERLGSRVAGAPLVVGEQFVVQDVGGTVRGIVAR